MSTNETGQNIVPKSKRNRKDKPWDNPDIDHWKIQPINPDQINGPFLEESSFSVLFPQYREKYVQECQGIVKKKLMEFGIKFELNLLEGSMTVRTTKKTWDPYAIIKARDVIKVISRSVPYQQALRLMQDGVFCEVIKIRSFVRNKQRFVKRRQRLIGPNGDTLKALQLLTECYILVQGSTVSIIGSFKNIKVLRRIIVDTMQNVHPIYHIKELMVKRQLMKDEKMKDENWDKYLPKFKQVKVNKKKSKRIGEKKQYTPFPPEPIPRQEDIKMETGEYFLSEKEIKQRKMEIKKKKQEQRRREKEDEKEGNQNEESELRKQIERQNERKQKKEKKEGKVEESVEELREKFLTKPIKKLAF